MIKREKVQTIKNFVNALHTDGWHYTPARNAVCVLCASLGLGGKTVDAWVDAVKKKWGVV